MNDEIAHRPGEQLTRNMQTIIRRKLSAFKRLKDTCEPGLGARETILVSQLSADKNVLNFWNSARRRLDTSEHKSAIRDHCAFAPYSEGKSGDRKVAVPSGYFVESESPSGLPDRKIDPRYDLIGLDSGGVKPLEKIGRRNTPLAASGGYDDFGVQADRAGGEFGRWIGERKASAERAAIADGLVRDMLKCLRQEREMHAYLLRPQHIVVPGASANRNSADATGYRVQLRNAVYVDQNARLRNPEIQHWHQALTAGQHGGVAFVTAQKSESFRERLRASILKAWRLHCAQPAGNELIARRTATGETGKASMQPANGANASLTAFRSAARAPQTPASPAPFAPSSVPE
jgi:hypothetical protein